MPRIGVVVQGFYPRDREVRVRKIVRTLAGAGHETFVMCRNRSGRPRREELGRRVVAIRFGGGADGGAGSVRWHPLPVNPLWLGAIRRTAGRERLDLLLATNLRLALPTALAARGAGIPSVFDIAEYFPTQARVQKAKLGPVERVVKRPGIIRAVESLSVRLADHAVVVVEEQKRRLVEAGVGEDRVTVVSNTPVLPGGAGDRGGAGPAGGEAERAAGPDATGREPAARSGGLRLVYTGIVTRGRGLSTVLRALEELGRRWPDKADGVSLTVVGDGTYLEALRELAASLGLDGRVRFVGWVDPEEIPAHLEAADVGLIPHVVSDFWNHTVPNKLFDYMSRGLPVATTPCRPVRRIVEREGCGVVVPEDPSEMAAALHGLLDSSDRLGEMGERGRAAVERTYNWERDGSRYLRVVEALTGGPRP